MRKEQEQGKREGRSVLKCGSPEEERLVTVLGCRGVAVVKLKAEVTGAEDPKPYLLSIGVAVIDSGIHVFTSQFTSHMKE